ncbi:MAG: hypothetical protein ACO2ON_01640 [Candidatus Nanopusillus sp.]
MADTNLTYNITMIITPGDISSIYYYPILFLFLMILPIIIIFVTLKLKLSEEAKIIIFFLNLVFSLFLPILLTAIYMEFQTLTNIYGQLNLYNQIIFNIMTVQNFMMFSYLISILYQGLWLFITAYIFVNLFLMIAYMIKKW